MATQLWHTEIETYSFAVAYEGLSGMLINLDLYILSKAGELIDSQPLWQGKAVVALSEAELSDARLMIGPPLDEVMRGPITLDVIRACQGVEVGFTWTPGQRSVVLAAVPESVWRQWQRSGTWSKARQAPKPSFLFW